MSKSYTFYIDGMTCTSCSGIIESCLRSILSDKLHQFHADITTADPKKTIITLNEDKDAREDQAIWSELKKHIEDIGFTCREYGYSPERIQHEVIKEDSQEEAQQDPFTNFLTKAKTILASHWMLGALGCTSGLAVLIACIAAGGSLAFMIPIALFSTLTTLALGANSYYEAWSKLTKSGSLTMDSLFALSSISILAVSIASLFVPWLPMMFESGLLIYGFRHIGIAIENTIKKKIGTVRFQDRASKTVTRQTGSNTEQIKLEDIEIEDIIVISQDEIIPLDGICENESSIYTTIITGSTLPHPCSPQDKVLAGMRLADKATALRVRVTSTHKNSYLSRLDAAIEQAIVQKAPIEIKTTRLLAYFIPTVIAIALISGLVMGLFFPAAIAIQCTISVLVIACPCTLGLIIPLAVTTGMHKAAEYGAHFKSAETLQKAEQIDTVIFDLNGTLTTGTPEVKDLRLLENSSVSETEFLSICATLEENAPHHLIGKAIKDYANLKKAQKLEAIELNTTHHSGITGKIKNKNYSIGSNSLMDDMGISIPSEFKDIVLVAGDQAVYMACDQEVIGIMVLTDPLREDAKATINALKAMGKEIHLCTGADEETALRYAKALRIDKVYANCIATSMDNNHQSKTAYIDDLKKQGRIVAMIGDAGNDALAIAASDLGIAIASKGGDELTQQAAGIVIRNDILLPIISAFEVSQQTVANINQNLTLSLLYNLVSISAAVGLALNPVVCVALMISQACLTFMNVYRFKQQPLAHLQQETKQDENIFFFEESSLVKSNTNTPACNKEPVCVQDLFAIQKSVPNESNPYSFWNHCFSRKLEMVNIEENLQVDIRP